MDARLKLRLLLAGKMKEAQRKLPAAVTDTDEQVAAAPVGHFSQQHLPRRKAAGSGDQRPDADKLRAVFVAQRQEEQQVLGNEQPELFELLRQRRADAFEVG